MNDATLSLFPLLQNEAVKYLLVLVRIGTMFSIFPVFSAKQIPVSVKISLTTFLAFFIAGTLPKVSPPTDMGLFAGEILAQIFVGLSLGFVGAVIFGGIQFAGELIDTQVGFAITNIINPMNNMPVTVLGQFEIILATFIFLVTDSHHLLIQGMAGSFHIVPLPFINVQPALLQDVVSFFTASINIVFKISIPIAVALLVTNVAMGLLSRIAPQVNVFIVAFPGQLGIGMIMFMISLPLLGFVLPGIFSNMPIQFDHLLRHMSPLSGR